MNRRRFLKTLLATVSALLVAPGAVVEHLVSPFIPGRRYDHFAMSWDGIKRHVWIDGTEVQCINTDHGIDKDILGSWNIYYMLPANMYYRNGVVWIAEDEESTQDVMAKMGPGIADDRWTSDWTRMSDDSPFEPPPRTDMPPVSDIGEGEDLIDSWW